METIGYKLDRHLTSFITDFADGNLDKIELQVFNEYLQLYNPVRSFAQKARKGREALTHHTKIKAADNFEEKLARHIAIERANMIIDKERRKDLETA